MDISIRQETQKDYSIVFNIIAKSFENDEYSDHKEQYLVEKLRKSPNFIEELSLVAEVNNTVVGYILLTPIKIVNQYESYESLAMAPVSVLPEYHGKGIGGELIKKVHAKAKELGHQSIVLLGHENYYPRFGYELASKYNIQFPFDAPDENCMVIALQNDALQSVSGTVTYPKDFFEI